MTPLWLDSILKNPKITDICLNGTHSVFVDMGNGLEAFFPPPGEGFQEGGLKDWVLGQLSSCGKTWDAKFPFIDASLPTGHRVHIAFPPLTNRGIVVSLRRLPHSLSSQSDPDAALARQTRWKNSPFYRLLQGATLRGETLLISGSTGSGKTTLATDLLSEVPKCERIVALEDTPELNPTHPHFVSLFSRPPNSDGFGEVTLRTLLRQTLRMRPDRIVLGECRGAEVLDLLQALNTGHKGGLGTLHANSCREALKRIELLCNLSGGGVLSQTTIRELLCQGVQWIAQVSRTPTGRRIVEVCKIEGREGDTILMRPIEEK